MTGMTPERLDLIRDRIDHTGYAQWKNVTSDLLDEVDRLRAGIEAISSVSWDDVHPSWVKYMCRSLLNPTEGEDR